MSAMTIRYKLDNKRWTETMSVDVGDVGDTYAVKQLPRGGIFRTRQIEIVITDSVPFTLKCIDDDVEVLR